MTTETNKPETIIVCLSNDTLSQGDRATWFAFLEDRLRELTGCKDVQIRYESSAIRDRFIVDGRQLDGGAREGFSQDVTDAWDSFCRGE